MQAPVGNTTLFTSPFFSYSSSGANMGSFVFPRIIWGSFRSRRNAPALYTLSSLTPWYITSQPFFVLSGGTPTPIFKASQLCSGLTSSECFSHLVTESPSPSQMLGLSVLYWGPTQQLGRCNIIYF